MPRARFPLFLVVLLLIALPVVGLPWIGSSLIAMLNNGTGSTLFQPALTESAVRLVTMPLVGSGGRRKETIVAVLDLPSQAQANRLCEMSPYLNDAVAMFIADNPERTDPVLRITGADPELRRKLSNLFPDIQLEQARLIEPMAYKTLYPPRDVYQCQGFSYRRVATKQERNLP